MEGHRDAGGRRYVLQTAIYADRYGASAARIARQLAKVTGEPWTAGRVRALLATARAFDCRSQCAVPFDPIADD